MKHIHKIAKIISEDPNTTNEIWMITLRFQPSAYRPQRIERITQLVINLTGRRPTSQGSEGQIMYITRHENDADAQKIIDLANQLGGVMVDVEYI